jgi:hypothetical protein
MIMKDKEGVVPRPASSGYCAGNVEDPHWNEGVKGHEKNNVVEIAPSPKVSDRENSHPDCGIKRVKSSAHAHSGDHEIVRGRPYEYQEVRDAVAKPRDKSVVENQTGSNRRLGN